MMQYFIGSNIYKLKRIKEEFLQKKPYRSKAFLKNNRLVTRQLKRHIPFG
jgi:hypothetical protein